MRGPWGMRKGGKAGVAVGVMEVSVVVPVPATVLAGVAGVTGVTGVTSGVVVVLLWDQVQVMVLAAGVTGGIGG